MPAATPTDSPGLPSVPAAGAITDSRRGPDLAQPLRLRASPHHPPNPGQLAARMRQVGRPGARPGPGLGAIGQHGRQQLGQRIGRSGHRRGRGAGAAAGFPRADRRGWLHPELIGPALRGGGRHRGARTLPPGSDGKERPFREASRLTSLEQGLTHSPKTLQFVLSPLRHAIHTNNHL